MTTAESVTDNPFAHVPHLRVLHCRTCGSLEELPDWEGRPEDDDLLNILVGKHGASHEGQLYRVPIGFWIQDEYKRKIIDQLKGGSKGLAAFDEGFYDTRNTFQEDAMKCYDLHLRPKGACSDWHSERKKLVPDTKADRKDAGLADRPVGPTTYLCSFCPVRSFMERKARGE